MLTRSLLLRIAFIVVPPVGAAALVSTLSLTWQPLLLLGVLLATAVQVLVLRRVTGGTFPFAAIPVVTFNIVGAAGYLYLRNVNGAAQIFLPDGSREFDAAAEMFALASISITAGTILASIHRRRLPDSRTAKRSWTEVRLGLAQLPAVPIIAVATIPLVLTVLGMGPAEVLYRAVNYYSAGPQWLVTISGVLAPLGVAGAAMVLFGRGARVERFLAGILLLAYVTVLFARDTRLLATVPIIVLALYIAQRGANIRRLLPAGLVALTCAFVFLEVPLELRGEVPSAGIEPYVSAIIQDPGRVLGSSADAAVANVLFSVPLTGFVAVDAPPPPAGALLTSLSPLPGSMTTWPVLAPLLRVNPVVPFSSLGELALQGALVSVLYFAVVGYGVTRLQSLAATLLGWRPIAMQLALGGLSAIFSVSALEYNLRSTTRYAWYALAVYVVLRFAPLLKRAPRAGYGRTGGHRRPMISKTSRPLTSR